MSYQHIKLELDGAIASLILAEPSTRNAMTEAMGLEVSRAVEELNRANDVRVLLVRGEGKAFAAGGNFAFIEERARDSAENNRVQMKKFYKYYLSIRELRVPSIAVIQGAAIGAGLCFAMACDLRVAASNAKLAVNFVRLGIHPGMGATHLLPRLVGVAKAQELLLTGRTIDAEEAKRIGLVNDAVPEDALLATAMKLAEELASAAPLAVVKTKATVRRSVDEALDAALENEALAQALDYNTADLQEGVRAFHEKRSPRFQGK